MTRWRSTLSPHDKFSELTRRTTDKVVSVFPVTIGGHDQYFWSGSKTVIKLKRKRSTESIYCNLMAKLYNFRLALTHSSWMKIAAEPLVFGALDPHQFLLPLFKPFSLPLSPQVLSPVLLPYWCIVKSHGLPRSSSAQERSISKLLRSLSWETSWLPLHLYLL